MGLAPNGKIGFRGPNGLGEWTEAIDLSRVAYGGFGLDLVGCWGLGFAERKRWNWGVRRWERISVGRVDWFWRGALLVSEVLWSEIMVADTTLQ
jgi:hypothetical protein